MDDAEKIVEYAKAIEDFCYRYTLKEEACPFYRGKVEVEPRVYYNVCALNVGHAPCNWEV